MPGVLILLASGGDGRAWRRIASFSVALVVTWLVNRSDVRGPRGPRIVSRVHALCRRERPGCLGQSRRLHGPGDLVGPLPRPSRPGAGRRHSRVDVRQFLELSQGRLLHRSGPRIRAREAAGRLNSTSAREPLPMPRMSCDRKLSSEPAVGVVRETESKTTPSFRP